MKLVIIPAIFILLLTGCSNNQLSQQEYDSRLAETQRRYDLQQEAESPGYLKHLQEEKNIESSAQEILKIAKANKYIPKSEISPNNDPSIPGTDSIRLISLTVWYPLTLEAKKQILEIDKITPGALDAVTKKLYSRPSYFPTTPTVNVRIVE